MTSTYVGTIKMNWGVSLPKPNRETTMMSTRGGIQGDGNAITELQYNSESDIKQIESLSSAWIDGKTFATEEKSFGGQIQHVIKHINTQAEYFYLTKYGSDFVVFELKGHTLTVYESYI